MKPGRKSTSELLSVVPMSAARMPPHHSLTEQQAPLWVEIVDSLPADFFRPGDTPLLAAYCKAWSFYLRASAEIEANGVTLEDERGKRYANPASQMVVTQASAMAQMATKLRLAPSSRYSEKSASTRQQTVGGGRPWEVAN
jgi:P27 family predicted phage terminase small subunit